MTTQQPEALRLADLIASDYGTDNINDQAAAELRRLYAEVEDSNEAITEWMLAAKRAQAINAQLLESLEFPANLDLSGADDRAKVLILDVVVYKARAAIAAAKGEA